MSWLRRAMRNWLSAPANSVEAAPMSPTLLHTLAQPDSERSCNVVAIKNGFLVCTMRYNPNGPNIVTATYAQDSTSLTEVIIAEMATQRLNQK